MPDSISVGWRKRIHSRPKEPPLLKPDGEEALLPENWGDLRRNQAWRKKLQGSRPGTPTSVASVLTAAAIDEAEDASSEPSETSPSRRSSRPKLTRYTSLFSNFIESSKGPEFSEPWGEDTPINRQPYVDPLSALQSIRSHIMSSFSRPIPLQHNNGLLRIFDDYMGVIQANDCLELKLRDIRKDWREAEDQWAQSERLHKAEIHRLNLLIGHGSEYMPELNKARQRNATSRNRYHLNTMRKKQNPIPQYPLHQEKLESDINARGARSNIPQWKKFYPIAERTNVFGVVAPYHPISPSRRMTAMSKQLAGIGDRRNIDLSSEKDRKISSIFKTQGELDLAHLSRRNLSQSLTSSINSMNSMLSENGVDCLADDFVKYHPVSTVLADDWDALISLRELGTFVARQRGLKVDRFVKDLMALLSSGAQGDAHNTDHTYPGSPLSSAADIPTVLENNDCRRIQSQPQLSSDQKSQRHFSFEPGDDNLQALGQKLKPSQFGRQAGDCIDSDVAYSLCSPVPLLKFCSGSPLPASTALKVKVPKPTKIPSPVQKKGVIRRDNSTSSSQSVLNEPLNTRRNSRSSIVTAFRADSKGCLQSTLKYRNRSYSHVRAKDSSKTAQNTERGSLYTGNNPSIISVKSSETEGSSYVAGLVKMENEISPRCA